MESHDGTPAIRRSYRIAFHHSALKNGLHSMQPYYGVLDTQTLCYTDTGTETIQEEKRCELRLCMDFKTRNWNRKENTANLLLLMVGEDKNESSWSQNDKGERTR